jgi:L-malate glycosyltransferase
MRPTVLHIANWYPNPWNPNEGNFIYEQVRVLREEAPGAVIAVQVRPDERKVAEVRRVDLEQGTTGYFCLSRFHKGRLGEILSTLLLLYALFREKFWRYDILHVHIAQPLLSQMHLWKRLIGKPIIMTEHWSAYHYGFHLPEGPAKRRMGRPFRQGFPLLAVSQSLLDDIAAFAGQEDVNGHVVPNVVPFHGAGEATNQVPVLFSANRWVPIKRPIPMLQGLALAAERGTRFELVLGGDGELLDEMRALVTDSALAGRTTFAGWMSRDEIARQLARSDANLFNSDHETFSIACAEALGAGVPLVGPYIPAIAEYAGAEDWQRLEDGSNPEDWAQAITLFAARHKRSAIDRAAIAERAARRFSTSALREAYRNVLDAGLEGKNDARKALFRTSRNMIGKS